MVIDQRRRGEKLGAWKVRGREETGIVQRCRASPPAGCGFRQAHAGKRFPDPQRQHMVLRFAAVEMGGKASVGHGVAQAHYEIIGAAPAQPQRAILLWHLQGAGSEKRTQPASSPPSAGVASSVWPCPEAQSSRHSRPDSAAR